MSRMVDARGMFPGVAVARQACCVERERHPIRCGAWVVTGGCDSSPAPDGGNRQPDGTGVRREAGSADRKHVESGG